MIRHVSMALVLAVLLAACGGQPAAQPTSALVAPTAAPAPTSVPVAATRAIRHALGEMQIPVAPQRIASLSPIVTDNLIALGVTPTAITTFNGQDFTDYEYLAEELQGLTIVGKLAEPNLEQLAQARPDLIIGRVNDHEKIYSQLTQIAPTVLLEDQGGDLQAWLERVAEVVDSDQAAARYKAYTQQAQAAGAAVRQLIGTQSVAFVRFAPDNIRLYGDERLGSKIMYADMGLTVPTLVQTLAAGKNFVEISLEQLPELDADHIFLLDQSKDTSPVESEVWQAIPAVQAGRVYPVTRDTWINVGIIASERVVESVQRALSGGTTRTAPVSATAAFPVTLTHIYGTTTIASKPQRVVSLGFNDQDPLLALGVKPVAVRFWFGDEANQVWPWAKSALGDGTTQMLNMPFGTLNYEAIAALTPDLIVGVSSGITGFEQLVPNLAAAVDGDPATAVK